MSNMLVDSSIERGAGAACLLLGIAARSASGPATEGQSLRGARLERLELGGVERPAARLVAGSVADWAAPGGRGCGAARRRAGGGAAR